MCAYNSYLNIFVTVSTVVLNLSVSEYICSIS